jgi:uncharacterized metal-binding protein
MRFENCCGRGNEKKASHEVVQIEKTKNSCGLCEEYAEREQAKPVAVLCCEGACLRGEIARQAANLLCHELLPEQTVRICLGGAFTKDTGQRALVRNAPRVVALEGCHINCASRMMQGVLGELTPEVIVTDRLCDFDRQLFGSNELPPAEIAGLARTVAGKVAQLLQRNQQSIVT